MKKYEFAGETKTEFISGCYVTLHRIRAVIDFDIVKAGDLGGWLEKEGNLSQASNAWVFGDAKVWGNAKVFGDAKVCKVGHVLVIGPIGSRSAYTTFFRDKDNEISVSCGCFYGKIPAFLKKVDETHGASKHAVVYRLAAEMATAQIDLSEETEG